MPAPAGPPSTPCSTGPSATSDIFRARYNSEHFGSTTRATLPTSETIGYLAATLTTASVVPQIWHTLRTRDVKGISLTMYSVFLLGSSLWLAYGLMSAAWPVVVANGVTAVMARAILVMKLRFQVHDPLSIQPVDGATNAGL